MWIYKGIAIGFEPCYCFDMRGGISTILHIAVRSLEWAPEH